MDVKITLPLLPLRDIVVFPSMVIPLFVGRDKSISALNEVMKKDKKIILVTQKNSEIDDPKKTDIFLYGCEGSILQLLKLPDGTVKVLVEGLKRVKILDFKDNDKFINCEYAHHNDVISNDEDWGEAIAVCGVAKENYQEGDNIFSSGVGIIRVQKDTPKRWNLFL